MRYQIKIVPDNQPNAEGEWIEVPVAPPHGTRFRDYEDLYRAQIPVGFHIVAIQKVD